MTQATESSAVAKRASSHINAHNVTPSEIFNLGNFWSISISRLHDLTIVTGKTAGMFFPTDQLRCNFILNPA